MDYVIVQWDKFRAYVHATCINYEWCLFDPEDGTDEWFVDASPPANLRMAAEICQRALVADGTLFDTAKF